MQIHALSIPALVGIGLRLFEKSDGVDLTQMQGACGVKFNALLILYIARSLANTCMEFTLAPGIDIGTRSHFNFETNILFRRHPPGKLRLASSYVLIITGDD